jgi:hypothetical protein
MLTKHHMHGNKSPKTEDETKVNKYLFCIQSDYIKCVLPHGKIVSPDQETGITSQGT